jgi:hypothetical protein
MADASVDQSDSDKPQSKATAEKLKVVADFLLSPTTSAHDAAWPAAQAAAVQFFPAPHWGVNQGANPFGDASSLFRNREIGKLRKWLVDNGIDGNQFAEGLTEMQYNSIQAWLTKVFPSGHQQNRGWRVRLIGFPSLQTIALGLASHYQSTPAQRVLGEASARIREIAVKALGAEPDLKSFLDSYLAATRAHWDGSGLTPKRITKLGSLDISGYTGDTEIRMARNTTVKKEIATFFAIKGMDRQEFLANGSSQLESLRKVAEKLGGVEGS